EAAPYPPPSDPLLATLDPAVSSSLGPGPSGSAHLLLLCAGPLLRFGFGPIIRLQLRLEPLFLRHPPNLHGSLSHCAIVSRLLESDSWPRPVQRRSWRRSSKVRRFGRRPLGPA